MYLLMAKQIGSGHFESFETRSFETRGSMTLKNVVRPYGAVNIRARLDGIVDGAGLVSEDSPSERERETRIMCSAKRRNDRWLSTFFIFF